MSDGLKALDDICNMCNNYEIHPKSLIKIYNKVMDKKYINSVEEGIELLKRYVDMNYKERPKQPKKEYKAKKVYLVEK